MKKKITIILSVTVCITTILLIFLCCCSFESCFSITPTIGTVRSQLSKWYKITLPDDVKMESYASDISPTDGVYFAVFSYDGDDEEFNSIFSYEENTDKLTEYFNEDRYGQMYDITTNFSVPSFDNKYGWLALLRRDVDSEYTSMLSDCCAILYFYELNKLVVYVFDL